MNNRSRFDEFIDRSDTNSYKWGDGSGIVDQKSIPMWVADMDFACPAPIQKAIMDRAAHPIYGYAGHGKGYKECIADWMKRRYGYEPEIESIVFSPPGVIYAVYTMIRLLTNPGERIVVLTPNYGPLLNVVSESGRAIVESDITISAGNTTIDFEDLEIRMSKNAKLLLFSNPHNPTGRVWKKGELEHIAKLCERYKVYAISDEIHADFVSKSLGHTPFPSLGTMVSQNCMACYSATKGFNLGGLQTATLLIADDVKRRAFEKEMELGQTRLDTVFGIEAVRAAYSHPACETWLDEAIEYVGENKQLVYSIIKANMPRIQPIRSEGTYLMLLDCSGLGFSSGELEQFFKDAGVKVCMGADFGNATRLFARINLACPRSVLVKALERIEKTYIEVIR